MFDSLFPKEWTTLQRLMWLKTNALARAVYETITGNPVSFTAKASPLRQLEVAFSPVQDLHGYDSPWPAGGGKNKIPYPYWTDDGVIGGITWVTQSDGKITGQGTTTMGTNFFTAYDVGLKAGTYTLSVKGKHVGMLLLAYDNEAQKLLALINPSSADASATFTIESDVTALRVYFNQGQAGQTVDISAYVQLEAGSSATSYAPYSNECPISGWDSLNVEQRGKNLLAKPFAFRPAPSTLADCFPIKAGTYTFSFDTIGTATNWRFVIALFDADGNALSDNAHQPNVSTYFLNSVAGWMWGNDTTDKVAQITITEDCYFRMWFSSGNTTSEMQSTGAMLELGTTATEYTPYNPSSRSISISLGQTVYSGVLDLVTGVGEITGVLDVFNVASGDGTSIEDSIGLFYLRNSGNVSTIGDYTRISFASVTEERAKYGVDSNKYAYKMCSMAKHLYSYNSDSNHWYVNTDFLLFLPTPLCGSTAQDAVNYLTSIKDTSPVEVWIPLATPIPIQLTPQEVESLAGGNVMWADGDSLTVEYRSN